MRHLIWVVLVLAISLPGISQDTDYQMFELFYFTPKAGHGAELSKAMSDHNKKYHPRGDYSAQVYSVINGPNAGKYVWSMGPTTWTKIENRPSAEGHDEDWDKNVSVNIESYDGTDFYKLNQKMSYFPAPVDLKVLRLWQIELEDGQGYRYRQLVNKVLQVYKDNNYDLPFGIYNRQLGGSDGYDVVMIWFVDGLQWLDTDGTFEEDFEAIHGEGSMENLRDEWDSVVKRRDVELWRFEPDMSGHDGKAVTRNTSG